MIYCFYTIIIYYTKASPTLPPLDLCTDEIQQNYYLIVYYQLILFIFLNNIFYF